jgi:hypothetical protein
MWRHPLKLDTVREDKAIENLTSRLTDLFADIHSPQDIENAVRSARETFAGDLVRDYVPILVERLVREELTPQSDPAEEETPEAARPSGPDRRSHWRQEQSPVRLPEGSSRAGTSDRA